MEGKEVRFGIANSALWATATTAASNGSVNSMHDSFTPLGGLVPMWLMQLGEVIFGGVGSGLYGMLAFVIVAVFVAGLMVGRTPEYLGKKIEAFEMKMASLVILIPVLTGAAGHGAGGQPAPAGRGGHRQPGPARLQRDPVRLLLGGQQQRQRLCRAERQHAISTTLALGAGDAGRALLADHPGRWRWPARWLRKKSVPAGAGTLPTHTPLFVGWLIGVVHHRRRAELPAGPGAGADCRSTCMSWETLSEMLFSNESDCSDTIRMPDFRHRAVPARAGGCLRQARPAPHGAQPGDVRGRGGQRADHAAVGSGAGRARARPRAWFIGGDRALALVHRAVRQLLRGAGRRARQGPGRGAAPDPPARPAPRSLRQPH